MRWRKVGIVLPGKHKDPTIAFRVSSWERALIEQRAALSGIHKKDFISRSCIYSNIVVTGTRENIDRIVDEMQIMEAVMQDIAEQFKLGNIALNEESFCEMREEYLAIVLTVMDILKGALYLYGKEKPEVDLDWKQYIKSKIDGEEAKNSGV